MSLYKWFRSDSPPSIKALFLPLIALFLALTGCENPVVNRPGDADATPAANAAQSEILRLKEGDDLKISFPGTPNLDTTQRVRRDGRITLPIVGEIVAWEKTPAELATELVKLYGPQLVSKEVSVTVVSSSFDVFVTGAVMKPGKISLDHAVTALEAIMEAGGFDNEKADTKAVVVIRNENGHAKRFTLNLKAVLDGKDSESFYLKSHDIVYVQEKFSWF